MPEITVAYERKFSDGNFGSEGLSISVTVNNGLLTDEEALDVAHRLRRTVLSFLGGSEAERVRIMAKRELNPPPPRQPVPAGVQRDEDDPF